MGDWDVAFSPMVNGAWVNNQIAKEEEKQDKAVKAYQATLAPRWFIQKTEYAPLHGTFEFLICGERAFGDVYRAIAHAKKSVSYICWGFQPSMYFIRGGAAKPISEVYESIEKKHFNTPLTNAQLMARPLPIGELLRQKALQGVQVRVLCWDMRLPDIKVPLKPPMVKIPVKIPLPTSKLANLPGLVGGETTTPGRQLIGGNVNEKGTSDTEATKAQYKYDQAWYLHYDKQLLPYVRRTANIFAGDQAHKNLHFFSRGFSHWNRMRIFANNYDDRDTGLLQQAVLSVAPTHHQKTVLVDYEDPQNHLCFVMGHNTLDEYWDTPDHSCQAKPPERGRNGKLPREDLSSCETGPVIGNVYYNFKQAWEKQTGDKLPPPDVPFEDYPLYPASLRNLTNPEPKKVFAHVVRTQKEKSKEDIKKTYLHVVQMATQCIFVENQYFRWTPFADKVKEVANKLTAWNRKPEGDTAQGHGSLYLFVLTNSSDEGLGPGAKNTLRMMESLGRADTMPNASRTNKINNINADLRQEAIIESECLRAGYKKGAEDSQRRQDELIKQRDELEQDNKENKPLQPEDVPGLKIHVCTLVPPDTPKGKAWDEVYIHSKLMIIDDTYMTLGSANINTRSMQVDTELNISHVTPEIAQKARQDLWKQHTAGMTGGGEDYESAFEKWNDIIKENKDNEDRLEPPIASLRGFLRLDPSLKDMD